MSVSINPPSSSGSRSLLVLVVEQPGVPRQEFFVQHGLTIGRNASNAICIDDPAVERIHALLQRRPDGSLVLECQDENAVIVDQTGQAVRQLDLHDGVAFTIRPASIRCVAHQSRVAVSGSPEPWEISCPRCAGDLTNLPPDTSRCPHCGLHIIHVQSAPRAEGEQQSSQGEASSAGFNGWLPKVVGPYDIRAFVAQGGMGIVLRGIRRDTETPAAVKLLRGSLQADEISSQRFAAEVAVLSRLRHPNLVMLQDHGQDGNMLWLAMDWVDGQALSVLLAEGTAAGKVLELRQVGTIMQQLTAGLGCLHEQGIIHRDLKPGNILVARDGLIKITDMGIAKTLTGGSAVTAVTRTGSVVGTDAYMAPEQMEGQIATPASDIYGLGVIWYELLVGHLPRGAFGTPSVFRPDCPGNWSEIVLACLSPEPSNRPTLTAIMGAISQPAGPYTSGASEGSRQPQYAKKRGRAGKVIAVVAAAAIAASIVVVGWFFWPKNSGRSSATKITTTTTQKSSTGQIVKGNGIKKNTFSSHKPVVIADNSIGHQSETSSTNVVLHHGAKLPGQTGLMGGGKGRPAPTLTTSGVRPTISPVPVPAVATIPVITSVSPIAPKQSQPITSSGHALPPPLPPPPEPDPEAINVTSYHQAVGVNLLSPRGTYYLRMPGGSYRLFATPGIDPVTHKQVHRITMSVAGRIERWFITAPWPEGPHEIHFVSRRQGRHFNFFPHGGLWYDRGGSLGYRIFDGPGVDPHTGRKLKPLTPHVVRRLRENIRSAIWSAHPGN